MKTTKILAVIRQTHSQGNYSSYDIESVEEGYGMTLGNALRCILLSSLSGAAITSIRIEGVRHEYKDIPHVLEDVADSMTNRKQLHLRFHRDEPMLLCMKGRGQEVGSAEQIVTASTVEIVNPNLHIATLDNEQEFLILELIAETGIGYVPAEPKPNHQLGIILIDAIYTPNQKVNYRVKHTRVGQTTNYDKIVLEIWTNGTLTPERVFQASAQILAEHFTQLTQYQGPSQESGTVPPIRFPLPQQVKTMPIEDPKISPRIYHSLKRANISHIGQVLEMEREELLDMKHFEQKSLKGLYERLQICRCMPEVSHSRVNSSPGEPERMR